MLHKISERKDEQRKDEHRKFLGQHILTEFWNCQNIDNPEKVELALIIAANAAGANVIGSKLHHFGEGKGVTGVLLLSESHISIHSWPEFSYAAIDIFVCGTADPHKAVDSLRQSLLPTSESVTEHYRGELTRAEKISEKNSSISIIRERRNGERRVILTPEHVSKFVKSGFTILIEDNAGAESGFDNKSYELVGAHIASQSEAWMNSNIVFKYKAPSSDEYQFFRQDLHLASFMHAEGNLNLVKEMKKSKMSAYALEFFKTTNGEFPVPVSDNEISGKLAVLVAAYHLQTHTGGSGVLLADTPGAQKPKVVVIGYGNAGGAAARLAVALGADVTVFGSRWEGLRRFWATVPSSINYLINEPDLLESAVIEADVVIGAILISTYDTPVMLSDDLVKKMKPGSIIVDVTCGYGSGYMPSFNQFTNHISPFFERYGVLHCKIDAMPASVPRTATCATSSNVWRYLLNLAVAIKDQSIDVIADHGKVVADGQILHREVLRHLNFSK